MAGYLLIEDTIVQTIIAELVARAELAERLAGACEQAGGDRAQTLGEFARRWWQLLAEVQSGELFVRLDAEEVLGHRPPAVPALFAGVVERSPQAYLSELFPAAARSGGA